MGGGKWIIQQMILGQLKSYLSKNEIVPVSHTLCQDEFQMGQRFKCKEVKMKY